MEGLYLHNLIVWAFCADSEAISLYVLMGWGKISCLLDVRDLIKSTGIRSKFQSSIEFSYFRIEFSIYAIN